MRGGTGCGSAAECCLLDGTDRAWGPCGWRPRGPGLGWGEEGVDAEVAKMIEGAEGVSKPTHLERQTHGEPERA